MLFSCLSKIAGGPNGAVLLEWALEWARPWLCFRASEGKFTFSSSLSGLEGSAPSELHSNIILWEDVEAACAGCAAPIPSY